MSRLAGAISRLPSGSFFGAAWPPQALGNAPGHFFSRLAFGTYGPSSGIISEPLGRRPAVMGRFLSRLAGAACRPPTHFLKRLHGQRNLLAALGKHFLSRLAGATYRPLPGDLSSRRADATCRPPSGDTFMEAGMRWCARMGQREPPIDHADAVDLDINVGE